jgi:hypothetical protein
MHDLLIKWKHVAAGILGEKNKIKFLKSLSTVKYLSY